MNPARFFPPFAGAGRRLLSDSACMSLLSPCCAESAWPGTQRLLASSAREFPGGAVRVSFFEAGSGVKHGRLRKFLGLRVSHCALEGRGWDLLWGPDYGCLKLDLTGVASEQRRRLDEGRAARVWGELYEARDVREEYWLYGGDSRRIFVAAARQAACGVREFESTEPERLAGGPSARAVAEVLSAGGLLDLKGRAPRVFTCDELREAVRARADKAF